MIRASFIALVLTASFGAAAAAQDAKQPSMSDMTERAAHLHTLSEDVGSLALAALADPDPRVKYMPQVSSLPEGESLAVAASAAGCFSSYRDTAVFTGTQVYFEQSGYTSRTFDLTHAQIARIDDMIRVYASLGEAMFGCTGSEGMTLTRKVSNVDATSVQYYQDSCSSDLPSPTRLLEELREELGAQAPSRTQFRG